MRPVAETKVTFRVLTTDLLVTDYEQLVQRLEGHALRPGTLAVDFCNTHTVTLRRHDPGFARIASSFDLFIPDGMPLVWMMNLSGAQLKDRVYGPTFMRKLLAGSSPQFRHYLVGGNEECGQRLRQRMLQINPGLDFVGSFNGICSSSGYLEPPEIHELVIEDIRAKAPHFVWVGLGAPKQHAFIAHLKRRLPSGVLLAVGYAFDVNAGTKQDAPPFLQRHGLTWLFRLSKEPKRLLGRYAKYNFLFLLYLLRGRVESQVAQI